MTAAIITAVSAIIGGIGAYFKWKGSTVRQRRLAEEAVEVEEREIGERRAEIEEAVYGGDDEAVNEIVSGLIRG